MFEVFNKLPAAYYQDKQVMLVHGDCRTLLPTINDSSIHLVLTDPPFGRKNNDDGDLISSWERAIGKGQAGEARPISNDGEEANKTIWLVFNETNRLLVKGGVICCCCGGGGPEPQFARWSLWMAKALQFDQMLIWDKGPMGLGWKYRRSYETILVGYKKGSSGSRWFDDSRKIENVIRPGAYGIKKIIPRSDQHPTVKPVELMELFIRLHTQPGDVILEPFAGSGTTLIAAKKLGRRAIGFELDQRWCDLAVNRLKEIP